MPTAIVPGELADYASEWKMSPGLEHNGFLFMTGHTGADESGVFSDDPAAQIEHAFRRVKLVLDEAGLGFEHIVEMTSYHIGLHDHLELFRQIRARTVSEPYPAWTAIEISGLASKGAVVELRCIARRS